MVTKKDLFVVLITLCLASVLFMAVRSHSSSGAYDPLADYNEDGVINMKDIAYLVSIFNLHGQSLNRTALLDQQSQIDNLNMRIDNLNASLVDLRSEVEGMNATNMMPLIDSLNASLIGLQSDIGDMNLSLANEIEFRTANDSLLSTNIDALNTRVDSLNTTIAMINTTITQMNATITQLQTSDADLNSRVSALEAKFNALNANNSVTNLMLAPYAIPFNSTSDTDFTYTNMGSWDNMSYMAVTMTLNRTSHLLIMFSTDAYDNTASDIIYARAVVDGTVAQPYQVILTPYTSSELGWPYTHSHIIYNACSSYNFYQPFVSPGTHTIQIQWFVTGGSTGWAYYRTLTVIALPA
jgi:uncharacterized coiled-coil protein SlyX